MGRPIVLSAFTNRFLDVIHMGLQATQREKISTGIQELLEAQVLHVENNTKMVMPLSAKVAVMNDGISDARQGNDIIVRTQQIFPTELNQGNVDLEALAKKAGLQKHAPDLSLAREFMGEGVQVPRGAYYLDDNSTTLHTGSDFSGKVHTQTLVIHPENIRELTQAIRDERVTQTGLPPKGGGQFRG